MSEYPLLVATRSPDKLREIRQILAAVRGLAVLGLDDAGIAESAEEDGLERFDTFEANAAAKSQHFATRSGLLCLADDSGLCVDALGGAPGVRSKRFSGRADLKGAALDAANNRRLLDRLGGVPAAVRTARYVCAVALTSADGFTRVFRGECEGILLDRARGNGGFGYDPFFYLSEEGATFGELPAERKNERSHRARAVREAIPAICDALDQPRIVH
jgi:XTP/dITP diphosphohydrolase